LTATENFRELLAQLEGTENRISVERRDFKWRGSELRYGPSNHSRRFFTLRPWASNTSRISPPHRSGNGAQGPIRFGHAATNQALICETLLDLSGSGILPPHVCGGSDSALADSIFNDYAKVVFFDNRVATEPNA